MRSRKFNRLIHRTDELSSPLLHLDFILRYDINYCFGRDTESEAED